MMKIYENGILRDMTDEEIQQHLLEQNKAKLAEMLTAQVSSADLLNTVLAGIPVTMPNGTQTTADRIADTQIDLPVKLGYRWQMVSDGDGIYWESVVDPNAIGTGVDNAIIYYDGVPLINNAFYKMQDGSFAVYMQGEFVPWDI